MSNSSDFSFSFSKSCITLEDGRQLDLSSPEAFEIISRAWIRSGWDVKYVYSFSWLGRPIIQLPEDIIRIQELIYELKPDFIIETGVAHGGSLIFYASICSAIGSGEVIGIDIDIRQKNRTAIETHELSSFITLLEGSSTSESIVNKVSELVGSDSSVLVILDSNHSKDHVIKELEIYSRYIPINGYIVACDGIMKDVVGAPRSSEDWGWNNPLSAIDDFLISNPNFKIEEPRWPFNEGKCINRVTYWPNAYLKRTH